MSIVICPIDGCYLDGCPTHDTAAVLKKYNPPYAADLFSVIIKQYLSSYPCKFPIEVGEFKPAIETAEFCATLWAKPFVLSSIDPMSALYEAFVCYSVLSVPEYDVEVLTSISTATSIYDYLKPRIELAIKRLVFAVNKKERDILKKFTNCQVLGLKPMLFPTASVGWKYLIPLPYNSAYGYTI